MPRLITNQQVLPQTISLLLLYLAMVLIPTEGQARIERVRATWRTDPATTMVIGWDQISGGRPAIFYDTEDHGTNREAYTSRQPPSWANQAKGMNNVFVRLEGLRPNTTYYFLITDTEGTSQRYSFRTAPNTAHHRLSIIAGSDSRNNREVRQQANKLVSKLRPHFVLFGGDMTDSGTPEQWKDWFNDWQLTIGSDGRVFPIVVARGNHEESNEVMSKLFDVVNPKVFYGLTFGGDLLRVYTLNTQYPGGGDQRDWLGRDLQAHQNMTWRLAQYHEAIQPHTAGKRPRKELILQWATLFHKFKVQAVIESDAHVVKTTWPIKPGVGPGSEEGFVRDDKQGTVYLGEGGWGAPLRTADDSKVWTREMGKFNQFKWIFVDKYSIEVRTVKTAGTEQVAEVNHADIFTPPRALPIWTPASGPVVRIANPNAPKPPTVVQANPTTPAATGAPTPATLDANGNVQLEYTMPTPGLVQLVLFNSSRVEVARLEYKDQAVGPYQKSIDLSKAPRGTYTMLVKGNNELLRRYEIKIP